MKETNIRQGSLAFRLGTAVFRWPAGRKVGEPFLRGRLRRRRILSRSPLFPRTPAESPGAERKTGLQNEEFLRGKLWKIPYVGELLR